MDNQTEDDVLGPAPPPPPERRLTRSTDDRVVAGVCGGLARHTGLDPVLFRIGFALGAIFGGGLGLLAYILAWIFVPEDTDPVGERRPGDRGSQLLKVLVIGAGIWIGLSVLGFLAFSPFGPFSDGPWGGTEGREGGLSLGLVFAALGIAAAWYFSQRGGLPGRRSEGAATDSGVPDPSPPSSPATPKPPPSRLVPVTLSALVLLTGLAVAADQADLVDLDAALLASALLVATGAALVTGAWFGRGRPLIFVGVALVLVATAASVINVPLSGGAGDRTWRPTSAADIDGPFRLAVGSAVLDLRQLVLSESVDIDVEVGLGELVVIQGINPIQGRIDLGAGQLDYRGNEIEGTGIIRRFELGSFAFHHRPNVIDLDLTVGAGKVEVVG